MVDSIGAAWVHITGNLQLKHVLVIRLTLMKSSLHNVVTCNVNVISLTRVYLVTCINLALVSGYKINFSNDKITVRVYSV